MKVRSRQTSRPMCYVICPQIAKLGELANASSGVGSRCAGGLERGLFGSGLERSPGPGVGKRPRRSVVNTVVRAPDHALPWCYQSVSGSVPERPPNRPAACQPRRVTALTLLACPLLQRVSFAAESASTSLPADREVDLPLAASAGLLPFGHRHSLLGHPVPGRRAFAFAHAEPSPAVRAGVPFATDGSASDDNEDGGGRFPHSEAPGRGARLQRRPSHKPKRLY
jgi:hypothetical protein